MQYLLLIHDDEAHWGDMPEHERNAIHRIPLQIKRGANFAGLLKDAGLTGGEAASATQAAHFAAVPAVAKTRAALEEEGLRHDRLHGVRLIRLGDEEGGLGPFARQQPVGIGGDEDHRHFEGAQHLVHGVEA